AEEPARLRPPAVRQLRPVLPGPGNIRAAHDPDRELHPGNDADRQRQRIHVVDGRRFQAPGHPDLGVNPHEHRIYAPDMTATALPSQRAADRSRPSVLGAVKKIFFPVSPTYLFMIIPAIALFTFFIIYPAVVGMFYSFTNYVGYGTWHFVGLANYKAAFSDPTIRDSYGFTLLFAVVACIVTNVVAMAL